MDRFEVEKPHVQRVDPNEARMIVERFMAQQQQAQDPAWPSVQDLAEALRTTPEEVLRMQAEVRKTPAETPILVPVTPARRPWVPAKAWHVGLGIVGALCLAAGVFTFLASMHFGGSTSHGVVGVAAAEYAPTPVATSAGPAPSMMIPPPTDMPMKTADTAVTAAGPTETTAPDAGTAAPSSGVARATGGHYSPPAPENPN